MKHTCTGFLHGIGTVLAFARVVIAQYQALEQRVDERLEVPRILPPAPDFVDLGQAKLLIVDDVADTGHTLKSVHDFCAGKVGEVRTAVIYEKSHSVVQCDYVWKRTDLWINFPWSDKPPVVEREGIVADA